MSSGDIKAGCIIHWKDYEFSDGAKADKYLVILGCKTGANYLAVLGTSKKHRRSFTPGCHAKDSYYHILGGKEWFPKDTWLILADPVEIAPAQFLNLVMIEKRLSVEGHLRTDIANAIRNCLKLCPDVSGLHLTLL